MFQPLQSMLGQAGRHCRDEVTLLPCGFTSQARASQRLARGVSRYLYKMRGSTRGAPPRVGNVEVLWSWLGSFLGIALVAWLSQLANPTWLDALGLTQTDGLLLIGSEQVHALGYLFVLIPATLGPLLMLLVALLVNNLASGRRYPEFWL